MKFDLFSCFQEFFIADLAKESYTHTAIGKRKTVQRKDMGMYHVKINDLYKATAAVTPN